MRRNMSEEEKKKELKWEKFWNKSLFLVLMILILFLKKLW